MCLILFCLCRKEGPTALRDGVFDLSKEGRIGSTMACLHVHPGIVGGMRFLNLAAINCQDNYSTTKHRL